jgi:hypothetical protein
MSILVALNHAGGYYFDIGECAKVVSGKIIAFQGNTTTFEDGPTQTQILPSPRQTILASLIPSA